MSDSPDEPPPWVAGPPPDYEPYEGTRPLPPDQAEAAHQRGRAICIAAIEAATGKTKTPDGRWVERDTTTEGDPT
jgi:hypothetical protein